MFSDLINAVAVNFVKSSGVSSGDPLYSAGTILSDFEQSCQYTYIKTWYKGKPGPFAQCVSSFKALEGSAIPYNTGQVDEANHVVVIPTSWYICFLLTIKIIIVIVLGGILLRNAATEI